MKNILVIGSTNIDIIARVSHLPVPGETVGNAVLSEAFGGKGANQAIAAARAGGNVTFVTCMGKDEKGHQALKNFQNDKINTKYISEVDKSHTGTALIFVDDKGENFIAVAPEANRFMDKKKVDQLQDVIRNAGLIILQLEIPYETVVYVIELAKKYRKKVLLNPVPARKMEDRVLQSVDYLILNESEVKILTGRDKGSYQTLGETLLQKGTENIILTLGSKGAYVCSRKLKKHVGGFVVVPVDTTAAGDTFCGAFAASILTNDDLPDAVRFANAAAALSVTKLGAQPSIPYRNEIETFLIQNKTQITQ